MLHRRCILSENDKPKEDQPKVWCTEGECFKYVVVCMQCKKKKKCKVFREYNEPDLLGSKGKK
jgi:hypothetical protein